MTTNFSPNLNIMVSAARKSSKGLIRDYLELCYLQSSLKSLKHFVQASKDRVIENLQRELYKAKPDYGFFYSEMKISEANSLYNWVVNPLDAIENFEHALQNFAISVGLVKKNNSIDEAQIIACVIEAPILRETYFTEKGSGAWIERDADYSSTSHRLRVSTRKSNHDVIVGLTPKTSNYIDYESRLDGSIDLAMAYVAAGKYDAFIAEEKQIRESAAKLFVSEAGGTLVYKNNIGILSNNIVKLN